MGKLEAFKTGVEKRRLRKRREAICLRVFCLLCFGVIVSATGGDDFVEAKEAILKQLAGAVQKNDAPPEKCALLKTCTATNCSRHTCYPQEGDIQRFKCMPVTFNKYCTAPGGGPCHDKYFDYTRSSVRTAQKTDFKSVLTTLGICAQRALDHVFQNLSKEDKLTRVYLGSIDGSWRGFPGSDQSPAECGDYDTRLRPWYRASTSVPKVVAILIDVGQYMGTTLFVGQGQGTILDAAKTIVYEFLKTLSVQDYVNIIIFDSTRATPLNSTMVLVEQYKNLSDTTYLPELDGLRLSLEQQKPESQPGTSNVALGINAALSNFGTKYPNAAKIILVLTDGKFATASNASIPTTNLTALNVKVFVYKIPISTDDNSRLKNTSFLNQLCSVGGSFEVLFNDLLNPILALNSFFTFTAALHVKVTNYTADYSIIYPGYEQIEGNISTVSIPVFGTDKKLVGVLGMDIFISLLGTLRDQVYEAMWNRSFGEEFHPENFLLSEANCSIQLELPSAEPCGSGMAIPPLAGFCTRTDMKSTIQERACCGSCKKKGTDETRILAIVFSALGGLAAIALVGLVGWRYEWYKHCLCGGKTEGDYLYKGPAEAGNRSPAAQTVSS